MGILGVLGGGALVLLGLIVLVAGMVFTPFMLLGFFMMLAGIYYVIRGFKS